MAESEECQGREEPDRRAKSLWPMLKRVLTFAFFAVVAGLLVARARTVDWAQVGEALRGYEVSTLIMAVALALVGYLFYCGFDLLGKVYTRHSLASFEVMAITFVSYAFNLNFGSLIGGIGFRYRLYSRYGLRRGTTTRILSLSLLSNWLGYVFLAGLILTFRLMPTSDEMPAGAGLLQTIGLFLLAGVGIYFLMCAFSHKRALDFRGRELNLPSVHMALAQLLLSCSSWLSISGIMFVLLPQNIGFFRVMSVLLMSGIAGVITHVPANIGVMEAVFVTFLASGVPESRILAAVFAYRAIFYLTPLLMALAVYLVLETRANRNPCSQKSRDEQDPATALAVGRSRMET